MRFGKYTYVPKKQSKIWDLQSVMCFILDREVCPSLACKTSNIEEEQAILLVGETLRLEWKKNVLL